MTSSDTTWPGHTKDPQCLEYWRHRRLRTGNRRERWIADPCPGHLTLCSVDAWPVVSALPTPFRGRYAMAVWVTRSPTTGLVNYLPTGWPPGEYDSVLYLGEKPLIAAMSEQTPD